MRRFILIRHSLPDIRPELPSETWHLSVEGQRRADLLADDLAQFDLAAIWSSAEPKAIEIAEFISSNTGLQTQIDARFNEQHRAGEPYLGKEEFRAAVSEALTRPDELIYGSETVSAAVACFRAGLDSADRSAPPGDVAVVSHGTIIAGYVASERGVDPLPVWEGLDTPSSIVISCPTGE